MRLWTCDPPLALILSRHRSDFELSFRFKRKHRHASSVETNDASSRLVRIAIEAMQTSWLPPAAFPSGKSFTGSACASHQIARDLARLRNSHSRSYRSSEVSLSPPIKKARRRRPFFTGGESEIRTHGRCYPTHAFQACALNHSATSPR